MTFNVLTVRQATDDGDDSMYPLVGDQELIGLDDRDGPGVRPFVATGIAVSQILESGQTRELMRVRDVTASVFVTASRVAVACEKYEKGGGWIGFGGVGVASALALNAASKMRARARRRGKVLVGHVRYPWLATVGYKPKTGWLDSETVRMRLRDGTSTPLRNLIVDITLPKEIDSGAIAQMIARCAAAFRLSNDASFRDGEREQWTALASAERLPAPDARHFALYVAPTFWNATPTVVGAGNK